MKKIIVATFISCLVCFGANGQSPATNINAKVEAGRKTNGTVLVHSEEGKFKVYALFKKSKVSEYYAIDVSGNKINPTYTSNAGPRCFFCISNMGKNVCYEVECTNIPSPKTTATQIRN